MGKENYSIFDIIIFNSDGILTVDTITGITEDTTIHGSTITYTTAKGVQCLHRLVKKVIGNLNEIKIELESNDIEQVTESVNRPHINHHI